MISSKRKKQTTDSLIIPTTHLFPLAGQSGSRGVSSMINFEITVWNSAKLYQSIQSFMSVLNESRKKSKKQKSEMDADPPLGDGERTRKSLLKKDFLLLLLVKISARLNIRNLFVLI